MRDTPPNARIIRHAAYLWAGLCKVPNIDNGDMTEHGMMGRGPMAMTVKAAPDGVLRMYEDAIFEVLSNPSDGGYYHPNIGCDYGPDGPLQDAHKKLPGVAQDFDDPIKTDISFYSGKHIEVSAGYAAPHIGHYPLPDGRWAKVAMDDLPEVIAAFAMGEPTHLLEVYSVPYAHYAHPEGTLSEPVTTDGAEGPANAPK